MDPLAQAQARFVSTRDQPSVRGSASPPRQILVRDPDGPALHLAEDRRGRGYIRLGAAADCSAL